jgi:hypothetical protein
MWEMTMRIGWRWLLLVVLGATTLGWALALARARGGLSEDEATAYSDELERMQDA